ncbi:olfactory receptor 1509-like isoform X2 [Brienomyrus brachyistius]|uniref:olfactory receptor 1509-like isoform X2 n=1 Tax=Brienomyrus brachyistius TaxID=42636 RepID=UPI0020B3B08A|nr:olfactory receptor 1509-like isoform X2 [Brienomyrus brachyistius]XP_048840639.1 olfactory receptor 1509-like isoform X2 [Brienomyrus brachyistius]XP_048840640.1 olfactory receptor 1509-like isoform X2 [Brienomyrus brachyistius]
MQFNESKIPSILSMEPLGLSPSAVYPMFLLGLTTYCLILVFNLTLILTIALNRQLHKPMFLLLINLPINDIMGATAFYPQLMDSILSQDRTISQAACFVQAVLVHLYGGGNLLILTIMAYDRYVAICLPLRYNAIMSLNLVAKLITTAWLYNFVTIGVLFILLARFRFCRSAITDTYCNNPSLMKLVCEDISINNYYGLFLAVLNQSVSLVAVVITYVQILLTCLVNKRADAQSKAIRTCATHLVVFVLYGLTTLFTIVSHRFSEVSAFLRRSVGVSFLVFPPILSPLIYGLNTSEIRTKVLHMRKKSPTFPQLRHDK